MLNKKSTNKEMRREKRTKKMKIILACVLLVILIIVIAVVANKFSGKKNDPNAPVETDKSISYNLPSTTYNNMEVKDVQLEYLKEQKQTMVTMLIKNTTGAAITGQQSFIVSFLDANNVELLNAATVIEALDIDAETSVSLILTGDFTSIKKVTLKSSVEETQTGTGTEDQSATETQTGTETETETEGETENND